MNLSHETEGVARFLSGRVEPRRRLRRAFQLAATVASGLCLAAAVQAADDVLRTVGEIERFDPALDELVDVASPIEVLGEGYEWSEGPVWVRKGGFLLFSDVPKNVVHQWRPGHGVQPYLAPSGFTGQSTEAKEPGSNGLTIDANGRLVLCQHGDRRVVYLDAALEAEKRPEAKFVAIADRYDGRRFNSPNDVALHSNGTAYFTDPPYGLPKQAEDPTREIDFCGVYRVTPDGAVSLVSKDLSRPNGIALSPDERTLYVANSDGDNPVWTAFDVAEDGTTSGGRTFFDAKALSVDRPGSPDGMKVDERGNLFATGPGGVMIISPEGKHLGTIRPGELTANCAFGDDGRTLYMTSDMMLCRVRLKTKGCGW
jgi:gluconolactonase